MLFRSYFEDGLIYFKAENGENFKVDIDALLKKALQSPSSKEITINNPEPTSPTILYDSPIIQNGNQIPAPPPSNIQQTQVKIENPPVQSDPIVQNDNEPTIPQKNGNVGGLDFFYVIKQLFYSLLSWIYSWSSIWNTL